MILRTASLRGLLAAMLTVAPLFVGQGAAAEPQGAREPVVLEVLNDTQRARLRCQLVLAHFITHVALVLDAGRRGRIALDRFDVDGTLALSQEGRTMAVENLLCGVEGDWAATVDNLDLGPLRDQRYARLRLRCNDEPGFACEAIVGAD
jgi:hypothetical protein